MDSFNLKKDNKNKMLLISDLCVKNSRELLSFLRHMIFLDMQENILIYISHLFLLSFFISIYDYISSALLQNMVRSIINTEIIVKHIVEMR